MSKLHDTYFYDLPLSKLHDTYFYDDGIVQFATSRPTPPAPRTAMYYAHLHFPFFTQPFTSLLCYAEAPAFSPPTGGCFRGPHFFTSHEGGVWGG